VVNIGLPGEDKKGVSLHHCHCVRRKIFPIMTATHLLLPLPTIGPPSGHFSISHHVRHATLSAFLIAGEATPLLTQGS
jgi:hypothetical protein